MVWRARQAFPGAESHGKDEFLSFSARVYDCVGLTIQKTEVCQPRLASDLTFLVLLSQPKTALCEVRELIASSAENATLRGLLLFI